MNQTHIDYMRDVLDRKIKPTPRFHKILSHMRMELGRHEAGDMGFTVPHGVTDAREHKKELFELIERMRAAKIAANEAYKSKLIEK
jgi:hypothetical protein